jgi:N,N'-diacetyllegionaminate synthase
MIKNLKNNKTFIIGEAGCNHNGSIERAFKLIDLAKRAKLDAVKFQVFNPHMLVTKNAKKANYAIKNTPRNESQLSMQKKISLTNEEHYKIKKYCDKIKITHVCSAFDLESIDFLKKIKLKIFKIPSGEINNTPYLKKISKLNVKVILSTGMSTINEIEYAFNIFKNQFKKNDLSILHCISAYPTKLSTVNLNTIPFFKEKFNCTVGFSDHTTSELIPALAVISGAQIIEKHFTNNKGLSGPDHFMSLNEKELVRMVNNIHIADKTAGKFGKFISNDEKKNLIHARKSIFANEFIPKGKKFNHHNIIIKRPAIGLSPINYYKLIGKKALKKFKKDEKIIC